MSESPNSPVDRKALLRLYDEYHRAMRDILPGVMDLLTADRLNAVLRDLELAGDGPLMLQYARLRTAVHDYAIFADRRKGRTLFQEWLGGMGLYRRSQAKGTMGRLAQAINASRFSVFDVAGVEKDVGVHVRDVLTRQEAFVADRVMSRHWKPDERFGARLVALPELHILTGEPIEAAANPGQDWIYEPLDPDDQARLQAGVIAALAEALRSC